MSSVEPLPAPDETNELDRPPTLAERDQAARDAARRALARAADERAEEARMTALRAGAPTPRTGRWKTLAAALAVVMLGAGTVSVATRGGSNTTVRSEVPSPDAGVAAARADLPAAAGTETSPSAAPAPRSSDVPTPAEPVPSERGAVYEGGHVTLRGVVPTRAMADALRAKAVAVVGAENVTDEYVIDPAAPSDVDGRVRIADPVLFRTASAELDPRYAPLLDAGAILMALNPKVVLHVVGHTDSTGGDEVNLPLSLARAQSVVDYVKAKGGFDDARFVVRGAGALRPIADNATVEGRRANRRIEVTILGLLDAANG